MWDVIKSLYMYIYMQDSIIRGANPLKYAYLKFQHKLYFQYIVSAFGNLGPIDRYIR